MSKPSYNDLLDIIDRLTNTAYDSDHPGDRDHADRYGPMEQDEQGGCVWCGNDATPHKVYWTIDTHNPECPWTLARTTLRQHREKV